MQLKEILDVILSNRPKDAINKIWGVSVLIKLVFCIVACFVVQNESDIVNGGSRAVVFSAIWIILYQIGIAGVGTLILKRLPTTFGIGFFLGLISLAIQQNVIISVSYWGFYEPGKSKANKVFGMIALVLAFVYTGLALLLAHFREFVIIQVGTGSSTPHGSSTLNNVEGSGEASASRYKAYEEEDDA
mmetsp:Transcript_23174/g.34791  ORF Transcript_23174/g.34791 Transcript_23174/m.34791 type:complete len:188 (-) Transcript_23174:1534-2097(-)